MAQAGTLTVRRFADVHAFEDGALPFLMQREAEHNLFLGICSQIKEGRYTESYLATVQRADTVVAAAFRTPPFQVGLSRIDDPAAIPLIAEDVRVAFDAIPGVIAAKKDALTFSELWCKPLGLRFSVGMEQRIYEATSSKAPTGVPGRMRNATTEDRDLLIAWFGAFQAEERGIMGSIEDNVDHRLSPETRARVVLWCDPEPVCLAGSGGPTPNGIRVGPVYTPPERRRNGYGTACVAALTQQLLDDGHRFVFLFTDLANPTSNSIYQQIGYKPVCDVDQYRFES